MKSLAAMVVALPLAAHHKRLSCMGWRREKILKDT
jgi:hypothetical protein